MNHRQKWIVAINVALSGFLTTACGTSKHAATEAQSSASPTNVVTFDVFNGGQNRDLELPTPPRVVAMASALTTLQSDIVCLTGYAWDSDKDQFIDAAKERFPYSYYAPTTLDTEPDQPAEQDGAVPTEPTEPPCATDKDIAAFSAGFDCVQSQCDTQANNDDGMISSSKCVQANCTSELLGLVGSSDPRKSCYVCAIMNGFGTSIKATRDACTNNPNALKNYRGQNPVLLLSRYPLTDTKTYVLPSTWMNQVVIEASTKLPSGAALDVYCTQLTPIRDGLTVPYTGLYGAGAVDKDGWANEQQFQAKQLVSFVEHTTASGKAIVLGEFPSSRADGNIMDFGAPDTIDYLNAQLTPAQAASYTPMCTVCSDNPLASNDSDYWLARPYMRGIASSAVQSTQRTFMDAVEFEADASTPPAGPMSGEYGIRTTVHIAP